MNSKKKYVIPFVFLALVCMLFSVNVMAQTGSSEPTNIIIDFDSTSFDSSLSPGDSGILNLVIQNTGGYRAEGVEIYIPSSANVNVEKRFYVGRLDAGGSRTIPVIIRVDNNAKTGLTAVNVHIRYDGYNADASRESNMITKWDVPLRVYGNPLFQLVALETTYYTDNLDELTLEGTLRAAVKDMESTLSSNCLTIIGSSKSYIGDLDANEKFNISYQIKPAAEGACTVSALIEYTDESGSSASSNITLGLNIEGAGVDFRILNVSYEPTGPGESVKIKVSLKNVGKADAQDTTLSLTLSSPFVPVDTTEKYIGNIVGGGTTETVFDVNVGMDASIQPYSIPLNVSYKVGGSSYSVKKDIGLDVSGKIILEIINVETSRGLQIEVVNIGTRTAEGVKAILNLEDTGNRTMQRLDASDTQRTQTQEHTTNPMTMLTGRRQRPTQGMPSGGDHSTGDTGGRQLIEYKSDIKPTKQTTFTFDIALTGPATLTLEYTGLNNERVTQTERITVGSNMMFGSTTFSRNGSRGSSTGRYLFYGLLVLIVVWVVYAKRTGRKIVPDSLKQKVSKLKSKVKKR